MSFTRPRFFGMFSYQLTWIFLKKNFLRMWFIFFGNCEKNQPVLIESLFLFSYGMEKNNTMLYNYMYIFSRYGTFTDGMVFIWDGTPSQNQPQRRGANLIA